MRKEDASMSNRKKTVLPTEIVTAVEDCGFFESIPLWAVTLIGGLFITVLSFIMIMSVYGRFFKLYLYTEIAPVPLSSLRESRARVSARALSSLMLPCVWRVQSSACLHHLFALCSDTACGQSRCGGGHNGMELCRGACIQYARLGRCGQNGRPCCP